MSHRYRRSASATLRDFADHADWTDFRSAVSLHSHTSHSREVMADLPTYIERIPVVAAFYEREMRARVGEIASNSGVKYLSGVRLRVESLVG